jgi:hypothetical protein
VNPLSAVAFWLVALGIALVVFGGWRAFQIVSAGATQVRANRRITRHSTALKGITRGGH